MGFFISIIEIVKTSFLLILGNFSQYHLNTVDIEKKFSHIGILRKNSHLSGFNILPDVMYVIILIKHLNLLSIECQYPRLI